MWFSWQKINGVNDWEEDRTIGLAPGRTDVVAVKVATHKDFSAEIQMRLSYHPAGESQVLAEKRTIRVTAPDGQGQYRIDWTSAFTAGQRDVRLDRTPIPVEKDGKPWGGYAGLSVRLAKNLTDWQVLDSHGREAMQIHGRSSRWVDFSGSLPSGKEAGVAILDHPRNLRHPSPWYISMNTKVPFGYFSPAPLFNQPHTLPAGRSLTLRYRVVIHPGRADAKSMDLQWKSFSVASGEPGKSPAVSP
jgi:hypothetical protein